MISITLKTTTDLQQTISFFNSTNRPISNIACSPVNSQTPFSALVACGGRKTIYTYIG